MERYNFETTDSPEIIIKRVNGTLRVKGWDRPEVRIDSDDPEGAEIKQDGDTIELKCITGCLLRVPHQAFLNIDTVHSDLMVKSHEGLISAKTISGQALLKAVGPTQIESVHGNFSATNVEGDLTVKNIYGNAVIKETEGLVNIKSVTGNLSLRGMACGLEADTKGSASLRLDPVPGGNYQVKSSGKISCRLTPDADAVVNMHSDSNHIRIKTSDGKETIKDSEATITLGDGDSTITLDASGRIELTAYSDTEDFEFGGEMLFELEEDMSTLASEITQQVTEQIESQIEAITVQINSVTDNLAPGAAISDQTRRKLDAKRQQLNRKLAQAQRKAEQSSRAAANRARSRSRRSYHRSAKKTDPVSDAERIMILEMVQQKKITVEEAEVLLAALEGREPDIPVPPVPPVPPVDPVPPVPPVPPVERTDNLEDTEEDEE